MYKYLILQVLALIIILVGIVLLGVKLGLFKYFKKIIKRNPKGIILSIMMIIFGVGMYFYSIYPYPVHFAMPPTMHVQTPDKKQPALPISSALKFLTDSKRFEKVADIGADPSDVPPPITRTYNEVVQEKIVAKEVISEVGDGIVNNYWTYNGRVPGPMFRVLEGDTVEMAITNDKSSLHDHNIDLHAVTGPGGGAVLTGVKPGETKAFKWKALQPGLYEYHCAMANVSVHNSHGQYGLVLVEPKGGLPKVDKEFYIMQGELYTQGGLGRKGLLSFDSQALLDGKPTYVTFNGRLETTPRMKAKVGDKIRIYFGNGGVNLISSFHIIGEIFDTVYPEGAIGSPVEKNVQTTIVPAGGATMVEFTLDVPGKYTLVDHALARMNKGAWAVLEVEGPDNPDIFAPIDNPVIYRPDNQSSDSTSNHHMEH